METINGSFIVIRSTSGAFRRLIVVDRCTAGKALEGMGTKSFDTKSWCGQFNGKHEKEKYYFISLLFHSSVTAHVRSVCRVSVCTRDVQRCMTALHAWVSTLAQGPSLPDGSHAGITDWWWANLKSNLSRKIFTYLSYNFIIISQSQTLNGRTVDLKVGTDKPKLKVQMPSISCYQMMMSGNDFLKSHGLRRWRRT